jgi:hypothetical protein
LLISDHANVAGDKWASIQDQINPAGERRLWIEKIGSLTACEARVTGMPQPPLRVISPKDTLIGLIDGAGNAAKQMELAMLALEGLDQRFPDAKPYCEHISDCLHDVTLTLRLSLDEGLQLEEALAEQECGHEAPQPPFRHD